MNRKFIVKAFEQLTPLELHRITQAREEVFYIEQGVTCPDADEIDPRCIFLWWEQDGQVAGFLRMIPPGAVYDEASIGRVLVRKPYRRQGLCREMMTAAMKHIAAVWNTDAIRLSAQAYLAGFYRSQGFEIVSELYDEAGIPHYKMLRRS